MRRNGRETGFTLVELLVVVIVIGILAAIAVPLYMDQQAKGHDAAVRSQLRATAASVDSVVLGKPLASKVAKTGDGVGVDGDTARVVETDGVSWKVDGGAAGYCIAGWHKERSTFTDKTPLVYDSTRGGIQRDGACTAPDVAADFTTTPGGGTVVPPGGGGGAEPTPEPTPQLAGIAMTYNTQAPGCNALKIALPVGGTVSGDVDWGDDSTTPLTANPSHTYAQHGTYKVTVNGTFSVINMLTVASSSACLVSVDEWGETGTTNASFAFFSASNLLAVDSPPASVTNYSSMFQQATKFNDDLSDWDTRNVTLMTSTFFNATAFRGNVSTWDTSKVTKMDGLFWNAAAFNGDVSTWNTAKVTTFANTFAGSVFNRDLSKWSTSSATTMAAMFSKNGWFNQPLNTWDTSKVTNLTGMFQDAKAFNQDLDKWDTSNVTQMSTLFAYATAFNGDISTWNTANVTNMSSAFASAKAFNGNIGGWNVGKVSDFRAVFSLTEAFNRDLSGWRVPLAPGSAMASTYDLSASAWLLPRPQFVG